MKKHRKRIATLIVVIAVLCLIIAAFFGVAGLLRLEHEQERFLRPASYYLAGGVAMLFLYYAFYVLPEYIRDRRSETARRRREHFKTFQRPPFSPGNGRKNNDGSVLILVLVLLGVVSAVALHAIVSAQAAYAEADRSLQMERLKMSALDAARSAMQALADDPDLDVDHPGETWAEYREDVDPAGISRMVRIIDAHRAFNLNNLAVTMTGPHIPPSEVLAGIMVMCGIFTPGIQIDALRDWVDADTAGPFETAHYQRLTTPYRAANRILYGWEELFHVDGWSAELFERKPFRGRTAMFEAELADSVDLLPVSRDRVVPFNINTVPPLVLQGLLGIGSEGAAERILLLRRERPFRGTGMVSDLIGQDTYRRLSPYLDVKSTYFHIYASAFAEGRSARVQVLAHRHDDGRVEAVRAYF